MCAEKRTYGEEKGRLISFVLAITLSLIDETWSMFFSLFYPAWQHKSLLPKQNTKKKHTTRKVQSWLEARGKGEPGSKSPIEFLLSQTLFASYIHPHLHNAAPISFNLIVDEDSLRNWISDSAVHKRPKEMDFGTATEGRNGTWR